MLINRISLYQLYGYRLQRFYLIAGFKKIAILNRLL